MYARVGSAKSAPERIDDSIRSFKERSVPTAKQQPGFRGIYFLINRKSGKRLAISLWETEEALQAAQAITRPIREDSLRATGASEAASETYEVVVSSVPAAARA